MRYRDVPDEWQCSCYGLVVDLAGGGGFTPRPKGRAARKAVGK